MEGLAHLQFKSSANKSPYKLEYVNKNIRNSIYIVFIKKSDMVKEIMVQLNYESLKELQEISYRSKAVQTLIKNIIHYELDEKEIKESLKTIEYQTKKFLESNIL